MNIKSFRGPHCDAQLESWLKSNHITTYQVTGYSGKLRTKDRNITIAYELPDKPKPSYRDWETDRKSTRLNSSHRSLSRMPSSA